MEADVVILGGGPAGAAAAGMLSRLGARVMLLTRAARHSLGEAIPPSTARLFSELDLAGAVDGAGFMRSRGNTVWWADGPARVEPFPPDAPGWQVERSHFDDVLLRAAEAAGAVVHRDAVVTAVDLGDDRQTITWRSESTERPVSARWVLDSTGRAGVVARRAGREPKPGRATFALHAVWEAFAWEVPDATHTLVETTRGGWAWSVPVTPRRRHVTVMVDPPSGTADGSTLAQMYREELAGTTHLARLTREATMIGVPGALSAAPYVATRFAGPGWALVGDAASFIDPLSSFGVKKALAAAWLAAVVVHTSLTDASLTGAAIELFEQREREAFLELSRQAANVWTGETPPAPEDPAVLAAFAGLKRAPAIRLRAAADVRLAPGPTVRGQRVVLEPHLKCGWQPDGIRYLLGVSLPRVIELAPSTSQVPDLYEQYVRAEGPTDLRAFLGVLSLLIAKGVLVQQDDALTPI